MNRPKTHLQVNAVTGEETHVFNTDEVFAYLDYIEGELRKFKYERDASGDAIIEARQALGEFNQPFLDDGIDALKAQLHKEEQKVIELEQALEELRYYAKTMQLCGHAHSFVMIDDSANAWCQVCRAEIAERALETAKGLLREYRASRRDHELCVVYELSKGRPIEDRCPVCQKLDSTNLLKGK